MKKPDGAARRAAALYTRWHRQAAYVFQKEDGSYDWTTQFGISSSTKPVTIKGKLTAIYFDGKESVHWVRSETSAG